MFKLFKRKNKVKELECRMAVLEGKVTALNKSKDKGIGFNNPAINVAADGSLYVEGRLIKGATISGSTVNCGNCNKEAIVPLKDIEFISKLAKELSSVIEENKENQSDKSTRDLILQIDGEVIGKVALKQLNKMQKQGGITLIPV